MSFLKPEVKTTTKVEASVIKDISDHVVHYWVVRKNSDDQYAPSCPCGTLLVLPNQWARNAKCEHCGFSISKSAYNTVLATIARETPKHGKIAALRMCPTHNLPVCSYWSDSTYATCPERGCKVKHNYIDEKSLVKKVPAKGAKSTFRIIGCTQDGGAAESESAFLYRASCPSEWVAQLRHICTLSGPITAEQSEEYFAEQEAKLAVANSFTSEPPMGFELKGGARTSTTTNADAASATIADAESDNEDAPPPPLTIAAPPAKKPRAPRKRKADGAPAAPRRPSGKSMAMLPNIDVSSLTTTKQCQDALARVVSYRTLCLSNGTTLDPAYEQRQRELEERITALACGGEPVTESEEEDDEEMNTTAATA